MARHERRTFGEILLAGGDIVGGVSVLLRGGDEKVAMAAGTSVPADGTAGFGVGCEFYLINAAQGRCPKWRNLGTTSSCAFRPESAVVGYGFAAAAGAVACSNGVSAFTTAALMGEVRSSDIAFACYTVSDDNDQILATICANGSIGATLSADPLVAHSLFVGALRNQCIPTFDIFAAGVHTTVGGGATEDITVTGVLASDIIFVQYADSNDTDVISDVAYQTTNTIRVTMSADPLTAHKLAYVVLRPRGSFKPSYYVYAAGIFTTVGGDAVESIAVSGMLATDVPIVYYNTTDDTDTIIKAVPGAGAITVTLSADPGATHALAYMVLRAY